MTRTQDPHSPSISYSPNGTAALFPYAMPRTVDEDGAVRPHGRYAIAYSRDGWYVLDNRLDVIAGWYATERDAIDARTLLLR